MTNKLKSIYKTLALLNVGGILATIYLTYLHFKPSSSTICNINATWNCDIVNQSIYSEIFGIPVAILGLVSYSAFLVFSLRGLTKEQTKLIPYFLIAITGGTLFSLYLTGVETFILKTYCIFCVIQQIIIIFELATAIYLYKITRK